MDRRGFLTASAALAATVAAPVGSLPVDTAARSGLGLSILKQVDGLVEAQQAMNGYYVAFMHPTCLRDLRDAEARDRWRGAYRAWRVASREGYLPYDPRAVLRDFGKPPFGGTLGRVEGFNIVESAA